MLQVLTACQHGPARLQRYGAATGKSQLRRPGLAVRCSHNSRSGSAWGGDSGSGAQADTTLAAQRYWLRRQRVLQAEPHPSDADIIELNVGGTLMVTSRSTLRQVPGSLLCLLFDPDNDQLLVKDTSNRVFLDHDPAVFSLVLRYLRELKVTGGCPSSVLLPAIPPSEASSFRSLAKYLGLQIAEAAITAAVLRGAAAAAAAEGGCTGVGNGKRQGSPYASRPAAASPNTQQWWQQQQQRQQLVRPFPPDIPPSGLVDHDHLGNSSSKSAAAAPYDRLPVQRSNGSSGGSDSCAAAAPEAADMTSVHNSRGVNNLSWSDKAAGDAVLPPSCDDLNSSGRPQGLQQQPPKSPAVTHDLPASDPKVQSFYIKSSTTPGTAAAVLPLQPLRVAVHTEADMMIQQQQQWQQRAPGSSASSKAGAAAGSAEGGAAFSHTAAAASCDIFCTVSSSRQLLVFSFVAKSSAGLDNVFIGATSVNHIDQRGLQIPSFGWRQINVLAADPPPPADSMVQAAEAAEALAFERHLDEGQAVDNSNPQQQQQQQQQQQSQKQVQRRRLWRSGDLVQVVLELGRVNRLLLKVNGQEAKGCHNMLDLPTFRQWCWYLALFRGTEVVAIVFEEGSFSIYNGDHKLKRFLQ